MQVTRPIHVRAVGGMADEDSSDALGSGAGESVQAKLQALPSVGRVAVRRVPLDHDLGLYAWDVEFLDVAGDLPELRLHSSDLTGDSPAVMVQTLRDGTGYVLQAATVIGNHTVVAFTRPVGLTLA